MVRHPSLAVVVAYLPFAVVGNLQIVVVEASDRRIAVLVVASSAASPSFKVAFSQAILGIIEVASNQVDLEIVVEASYLVDPSFTEAFGQGITVVAFLLEASSIAVLGMPTVAFTPSIEEDTAVVGNLVLINQGVLALAAKGSHPMVVVGYILTYLSFL